MTASGTFPLLADGLTELIKKLGPPSDTESARLLVRIEELLAEVRAWEDSPPSADVRVSALSELMDLTRAVNEYVTK